MPNAPDENEQQPKLQTATYDFTPAQLETVTEAYRQRREMERFISNFLGYLVKEAKLPKSVNGWGLRLDDEGQPVGMVAQIEEEK